MKQSQEDTVFVGAGIVSLVSVQALTEACERAGEPIPRILVVDKNPEVAAETSFANGGHVTLGEGLCVARSDTRHYMTHDYHNPDQPGWLEPGRELSAYEKEWQAQYLENCARGEGKQKLETLAKLGARSMQLWQDLADRYPALKGSSAFQYRTNADGDGLLRIYDESKTPSDMNWDADLFARAGSPCTAPGGQALPSDSALALIRDDPNLQFLMQQGGCIDARAFCGELKTLLQEKGVQFLSGEEVEAIHIGDDSGRIAGITTRKNGVTTAESRLVRADDFVFSPGASPDFRKKLGFDVPVAGLAGVTLTLPVPENTDAAFPTRPIKLVTHDGTIVISPLLGAHGERSIRVGGTFGFAGEQPKSYFSFEKGFGKHALETLVHHLKQDKSPVKALMESIDREQPDAPDEARYDAWLGLRPVAPDLMPVIGRLSKNGREIPNAYFNGLQAFAGTSYAPVSAELTIQLMREGKMQVEGIEEKALSAAVGIERFASGKHQGPKR